MTTVVDQDLIQLMPGTAWRWVFRDGTISPWRINESAEPETIKMPPAAAGFQRLAGEEAKRAVEGQGGRHPR